MFKSILPSKRIVSSDFTIVTPPAPGETNGKENKPTSNVLSKSVKVDSTKDAPKSAASKAGKDNGTSKDAPKEAVVMEDAFDKLLDDLQIPSTLRPKLTGMDSTVKAAMLKSSRIVQAKVPASPPLTPRTLRRSHSSDSMSSPRPTAASAFNLEGSRDIRKAGISGLPYTHHPSKSVVGLPETKASRSTSHNRGASFDVSRTLGKGKVSPAPDPEAAAGKAAGDKAAAKTFTPSRFCGILQGTSTTQMEVDHVKKLRIYLRNEPASWSEEFLRLGGYSALLTRLNEILEVEWREEQHDDQILHELLRCFKALSTSSIGCFALRSSCPTPFVQLVSLLYSDKKPGEVGTRQLITELLLTLFDLYPSSALPGTGTRPRHESFASAPASSKLITLPAPHKTIYELVRALLLTPAPPPAESPAAPVSPHAFIASLHRPRIFKTYLQELSDVCRDYFWVFCHPNNTIWELRDTDEEKVEKPRAPGGMTGGVEFEAMNYFTTHLKLINAIGKAAEDLKLPKENDHSAHRFHSDLFASGLERIILISRKASTTYYPTLHLELARYISLAGRARFDIPWTVSRIIGPPPSTLCKERRLPAAMQTPKKAGYTSSGVSQSPTKAGSGYTASAPAIGAAPVPLRKADAPKPKMD